MFPRLWTRKKNRDAVIRVEPGIWIAEKFLSPGQCREIVDRIEKSDFRIARQYGEGRHNKETFLEEEFIVQLLRRRFREIGTLPGSVHAVRDFSLPLEFYKYETGDFIKRHSDAPREANGRFSKLTLVLYLSDDCKGGETFFDAFDLKVNPRCGAALLFEQHLNHEALRVQGGTKYVLRTNCFTE